MSAREGMEKKKPSYTAGGNVNWCSLYRNQDGYSLKKIKNEITI